MRKVDQGIVGAEFHEMDLQCTNLDILRREAEALLEHRADPLPAEVRAKAWHELDEETQNEVHRLVLSNTIVTGQRPTVAEMVRSGLSADACQALSDAMTAYRDALPLTHAEHRWLVKTYRTRLGTKALRYVESKSGTVISDGQKRRVDGSELVSRLWDWVRDGDEYAANGTYNTAARVALQGISSLFGDWKRRVS